MTRIRDLDGNYTTLDDEETILSRTILLAPSDLHDLHNVGVPIVEAVGAGTVLVPHHAWFVFTPGSTPYDDAGALIAIETDGSEGSLAVTFGAPGAVHAGLQSLGNQLTGGMLSRVTDLIATDDVVNKPLRVFNYGPELSSGDGTLELIVYYSVVALP